MSEFKIKPVMMKPEIGDIVINDCGTPYMFQWGEDDGGIDDLWPIVYRNSRVKAAID